MNDLLEIALSQTIACRMDFTIEAIALRTLAGVMPLLDVMSPCTA